MTMMYGMCGCASPTDTAIRNSPRFFFNPCLLFSSCSLFSGRGFDSVIREAYENGPQRIEDLWLKYFCVTTNLSKGARCKHSCDCVVKRLFEDAC